MLCSPRLKRLVISHPGKRVPPSKPPVNWLFEQHIFDSDIEYECLLSQW